MTRARRPSGRTAIVPPRRRCRYETRSATRLWRQLSRQVMRSDGRGKSSLGRLPYLVAAADVELVELEYEIGFQGLMVAQSGQQPTGALSNVIEIEIVPSDVRNE